MGNQFEYDEDEEQRSARRKQRIAEMKREKERRLQLQKNIKHYAVYGGAVLLAVAVIGGGVSLFRKNAEAKENEIVVEETSAQSEGVNGSGTLYADGTENAGNDTMPTLSAPSTVTNTIETSPKDAPVAEANPTDATPVAPAVANDPIPVGDVTFWNGYTAETTADTVTASSEDVLSEYAVLINAEDGTIAAQKNAKTIINPASMTKILTVLVAAEHVTDLDDEFTMTLEITDYAYVNDCSSVGFLDGEVVTVRDLFYGTVLPSGGDAAVALATYVAGSHEAFVDMMNKKLEELGLSETAHFTNCVGLYDEEHYCSVYDMAIIMKAAAENELCREVLSARTYTTSATEQHPEGITISNWFIRRIEDKDTGGKVLCAKTGYVAQSGSCAASYGVSDEGTPYICVTAQTYSSWRCIYDHVALYSKYTQ